MIAEGADDAASAARPRLLYVHDLGLVDYDEAWAFQRSAAQARIAGTLGQDLLILCEHPPVVTLGRSTKPGSLLATPEYLALVGVQLRDVERGGDVTVHEQGQLVAYPIIDLKRHRKDLHWYLRQVEEAVIVALRVLGLEAGRSQGQTGVWIKGRKIASIGVHARDWVTWHGVAINVTNDLSTFAHVVPCGIDDATMTSVAIECEASGIHAPDTARMREMVASAFGDVLGLQLSILPGDASQETFLTSP